MKTVLFPLAFLALAVPALAQDDEPMDGKTWTQSEGGVDVTVRVSGNDDDGYVALVEVAEGGAVVARTEFPDIFSPVFLPEISFVQMLASNDSPEVFMSQYTGGAHCCSQVSVAAKLPGGWKVLEAGGFDGDTENLLPQDVDGDGEAEIVTYDNAFLYAFTSYAGSYAPRQVLGIRDGEIRDVSSEPKYAAVHRNFLENDIGEIPESGSDRNAWLAAWSAAQLLLGAPDPLARADAEYDKSSDWAITECTDPEQADDCPEDLQKEIPFPLALRRMLREAGYSNVPE